MSKKEHVAVTLELLSVWTSLPTLSGITENAQAAHQGSITVTWASELLPSSLHPPASLLPSLIIEEVKLNSFCESSRHHLHLTLKEAQNILLQNLMHTTMKKNIHFSKYGIIKITKYWG